MDSDDTIRSRLQSTIASLRYWVPSIADAARVDETERSGFWQISVTPKIAGACPFELILKTDRSSGRFDCVIGGEVYEDRDLASPDEFLPLVEAIADGRVIQRRWLSTATGVLCGVETIVTLGNGRTWQQLRETAPAAADVGGDAVEHRDRHFLPYRR